MSILEIARKQAEAQRWHPREYGGYALRWVVVRERPSRIPGVQTPNIEPLTDRRGRWRRFGSKASAQLSADSANALADLTARQRRKAK